MVLQNVFSIKKLRKWQTGHVWLLWRFRGFIKLENQAIKAKDKGMERHWWERRTHIWNKIQSHEKYAPEELQLEEFTQRVLKMINDGIHPKQILERLRQESKK